MDNKTSRIDRILNSDQTKNSGEAAALGLDTLAKKIKLSKAKAHQVHVRRTTSDKAFEDYCKRWKIRRFKEKGTNSATTTP